MSQKRAKISSIETLQKFHLNLHSLSEDTLSVLDRVNNEVTKRLRYLEHDLAGKWRKEHFKWKQKLRDANREISSSRTSAGKIAAEQLKRQAKFKIRECEEKLQHISHWLKRAQNELPLPQSRLLKLKTFIVNDVDKARILLKEYFEKLREYTEIKGKDQ